MNVYIALIVTGIFIHQIITARRTMATIEDLKAQVAAEDTVIGSAVTLINGLAAQIAAAKDDPAALDAIITDMKTTTDALAAAVSANTPATAPTDGGVGTSTTEG